MAIYQIIIVILSALMVVQGLIKFFQKKTHYSLWKLATRVLIWGGMGVVIVYPERVMNSLADFLGIKAGFNALILVGFVLVLVMIFRLLAVIENLEKDLTRLIREEALKKIKEGNHSND